MSVFFMSAFQVPRIQKITLALRRKYFVNNLQKSKFSINILIKQKNIENIFQVKIIDNYN